MKWLAWKAACEALRSAARFASRRDVERTTASADRRSSPRRAGVRPRRVASARWPPRAGRAVAVALAVAALALIASAPGACAQDFAPASPAGPQPGAAALLERALPAEAPLVALESSVTRWLASPALETRAAAVAFAPGALRVAIGLSQTGDPELGWTGAAIGAGLAADDAGFAVRAIARRDRALGALGHASARDAAGMEAGAGAWLAAGGGCVLWASAPQLMASGESPPLSRPLEVGARWTVPGAAVWCVLGAPRAGDDGSRLAGLSLGGADARVWAEARDGPLRASFGAIARVRALVAEARADLHPVLGETTRLALAWRPRSAR